MIWWMIANALMQKVPSGMISSFLPSLRDDQAVELILQLQWNLVVALPTLTFPAGVCSTGTVLWAIL